MGVGEAQPTARLLLLAGGSIPELTGPVWGCLGRKNKEAGRGDKDLNTEFSGA